MILKKRLKDNVSVVNKHISKPKVGIWAGRLRENTEKFGLGCTRQNARFDESKKCAKVLTRPTKCVRNKIEKNMLKNSYSGKAIRSTYSECVCVCVVIEHKMCVYFLYNFCLKHLLFNEEFSEVLSQIYNGLHGKYSLFLSDFNQI